MTMKHMEQSEAAVYAAPEIRITEITVENGFAQSEIEDSPYFEAPGYGNGIGF